MRRRMFLMPAVLLLTGVAVTAQIGGAEVPGRRLALLQSRSAAERSPVRLPDWRPPTWRQVRIEQRFSIRIAPGVSVMPPAMVEQLEEQERIERLDERRNGKCLGIAAIAAVQPGDGDELLLFLRDQRVLSVTLEKRCNARAFYSGFYVARSADGAICAGRDILQSRSGTNCKVRRFNELVASGFRRIP